MRSAQRVVPNLLKALETKYPRRIEIVKYFAGDKEGNDAIAKEIKGKYWRVETIILNAGESPAWLPYVMMSDFDHLRHVLRHCELHGKGARDVRRQIALKLRRQDSPRVEKGSQYIVISQEVSEKWK
jgi:hypothetical protein